MKPGVPESFRVLVKELQGLGLDVEVQYDDGTSGAIQIDDEEEKGIYAMPGAVPPDPYASASGLDMKQDDEDESEEPEEPGEGELADVFMDGEQEEAQEWAQEEGRE